MVGYVQSCLEKLPGAIDDFPGRNGNGKIPGRDQPDDTNPVADLSPSKKSALVACFNAGGLNKKDGAWHGAPGDRPVSGTTTADLVRDGMLTVTTKHAQLSQCRGL
jgi:hypothetical protein